MDPTPEGKRSFPRKCNKRFPIVPKILLGECLPPWAFYHLNCRDVILCSTIGKSHLIQNENICTFPTQMFHVDPHK